MKKILLLTVCVLCWVCARSQNSYIKDGSIGNPKPIQKKEEPKLILPYCILPYRDVNQTIGETFIVVNSKEPTYFWLKKAKTPDEQLPANEMKGKLLKLLSIEGGTEKTGHFTDSAGNEYICELTEGMFRDLAPFSDLEYARKTFLNKTLWLNSSIGLNTGDFFLPMGERTSTKRFEQVIVTDVFLGVSSTLPIAFVAKDLKGEVGFIRLSLSGTNTAFDKDLFFESFFLTEDPKVKYKLTPETFELVRNGQVKMGMTKNEVLLALGMPKSMNNSTTANRTFEQWVYDTANYYFTNGKLTDIQK